MHWQAFIVSFAFTTYNPQCLRVSLLGLLWQNTIENCVWYLVEVVFVCVIMSKGCLRIRVWSEPVVKHRGQAVVAHTFSPITREIKTGRGVAGWREEYKAEGDRSSRNSSWGLIEILSPRFWGFHREVRTSGWLLLFPDLLAFTA